MAQAAEPSHRPGSRAVEAKTFEKLVVEPVSIFIGVVTETVTAMTNRRQHWPVPMCGGVPPTEADRQFTADPADIGQRRLTRRVQPTANGDHASRRDYLQADFLRGRVGIKRLGAPAAIAWPICDLRPLPRPSACCIPRIGVEPPVPSVVDPDEGGRLTSRSVLRRV